MKFFRNFMLVILALVLSFAITPAFSIPPWLSAPFWNIPFAAIGGSAYLNLTKRLGWTLTPQDFYTGPGDAADGTHDATGALQAWCAWMGQGNDGYLPAGTYLITATVNCFPTVSYHWRGAGIGAATILVGFNGISLAAIDFTNPSSPSNTNRGQEITVEGFSLKYQSGLTAPPVGIRARYATAIYMRDVDIQQYTSGFSSCMEMSAVWNVKIQRVHLWGCGAQYTDHQTAQAVTYTIPAATILSNPFSTTNGSNSVTVAWPTNTPTAGETVSFANATAVGGLTISGPYVVASATPGTGITITASGSATSTASGGGSVTAALMTLTASAPVFIPADAAGHVVVIDQPTGPGGSAEQFNVTGYIDSQHVNVSSTRTDGAGAWRTHTNESAVWDGVLATSTPGSNILTLDAPVLSSADQGRMVYLGGAGPLNSDAKTPLQGKILSVSGTSVTLDTNATYGVTGYLIVSPPLNIYAESSASSATDDLSIYDLHLAQVNGGIVINNAADVKISGGKYSIQWPHGGLDNNHSAMYYMALFNTIGVFDGIFEDVVASSLGKIWVQGLAGSVTIGRSQGVIGVTGQPYVSSTNNDPSATITTADAIGWGWFDGNTPQFISDGSATTPFPVTGAVSGANSSYVPPSFAAFSTGSSATCTSAPPTPSGTCAINAQTGCNDVGAFTLTNSCTSQTVIFTFSKTANYDWSCSITDQTSNHTSWYQSNNPSTKTATFVGSGNAGDYVRWRCTPN